MNVDKLKELTLYVLQKTKDDPTFDIEKLCWILYYSDFEAFARFGKSITGSEYIRVEDVAAWLQQEVAEELKRSEKEND